MPRAWTMPLLPSVNSHMQARSRSMPFALRNSPPPEVLAVQLRLTRTWPVVAPCLLSEMLGADLVSVILESDTGWAGGC